MSCHTCKERERKNDRGRQRERERVSSCDHTATSSSRHSFVTGLSKMLVFVWRRTERTTPFTSDLTSKTFPIIQDPLEAVASATRTTSPGIRFLLSAAHFVSVASMTGPQKSISSRRVPPFTVFASIFF